MHARQLHHRLRNSLLPWQWNRARSLSSPVLFYCFMSPLCRSKPASCLIWQAALFRLPQQVFGCLFVYLLLPNAISSFLYRKHICLGNASVQEHPLVSRLESRSLIRSIVCTSLSIFSSLPLNFSSLSLIFSLSFSHSFICSLLSPLLLSSLSQYS